MSSVAILQSEYETSFGMSTLASAGICKLLTLSLAFSNKSSSLFLRALLNLKLVS